MGKGAVPLNRPQNVQLSLSDSNKCLPECQKGAPDPAGTLSVHLFGHSADRAGTKGPQIHAVEHSLGHPNFLNTLSDTPWDTAGLKSVHLNASAKRPSSDTFHISRYFSNRIANLLRACCHGGIAQASRDILQNGVSH